MGAGGGSRGGKSMADYTAEELANMPEEQFNALVSRPGAVEILTRPKRRTSARN